MGWELVLVGSIDCCRGSSGRPDSRPGCCHLGECIQNWHCCDCRSQFEAGEVGLSLEVLLVTAIDCHMRLVSRGGSIPRIFGD